jgi:hypothetical protein
MTIEATPVAPSAPEPEIGPKVITIRHGLLAVAATIVLALVARLTGLAPAGLGAGLLQAGAAAALPWVLWALATALRDRTRSRAHRLTRGVNGTRLT